MGDWIQMGMNKTVTLKALFAQFLGTLILLLMIAVIIPMLLLLGAVFFGIITNANKSLTELQLAHAEIAESPDFKESLVLQQMEYMVIDKTYNVLETGMNDIDTERGASFVKGEYNNTTSNNRFYLIIRDNEYVVVKYSLNAGYTDKKLNGLLPSPETAAYTLIGINAIIACVIATLVFARKVSKQIEPLHEAVQQIGNQNLDFDIGSSNIKELNDVLLAYDKMKEELKKSLEKQWKEEKEQREQIAALAHDLKTPLTIMYGNLDLLQETQLTAENKPYVQNLLDNSNYMEKSITSLIELSRANSGYVLQIEEIESKKFLESLKRKIQPLTDVNDIRMEFLFHDYPKVMKCDSTMLERAILNVISNAVDFTPKGGVIRLEVFKREELFTFEVTDSGKGFSNKDLEQSKQRFYMGDTSRSSRNHYGMGLTIADNIIAQHKGELILGNGEADLTGAKVILSIPI